MIQTVQLGISGSEVTLPNESRSLQAMSTEGISIVGRSADGTLHEDFIATKREWQLSYGVITQNNYLSIYSIYTSQFTEQSHLSLILTDQNGQESGYVVRMAA